MAANPLIAAYAQKNLGFYFAACSELENRLVGIGYGYADTTPSKLYSGDDAIMDKVIDVPQ